MEEISLAKKVRAMMMKLEDIRQPYESDYKDIAKYIHYRREFFDLETKDGQSIARDKYDGTAQQAAMNLAYGVQGNMVSRSIEWLDFKFANKELENYKEARTWLEDLVQYFYEIFKANGFYDTVNDNLMDAVTFGTPCMYSENDPDRGRIVYSERHPIEIYVAKNRYGEYDTVFRKYKMSAREILKQFDEANISDKLILEAEKSQSMYNEHVIIHALFPNEERNMESMQGKDKEFRSVYIEEEGQDSDITLDDSGYDDNPYTMWGWDINTTETFARSPSHNALPEVFTLNQLEKAILEATELSVHPPKYAPSKHRGRLHFYPDGVNYYENYETEKIEAINLGINLPTTKEERDDVREKIRGYFFNDFFLILSQMVRAQKTATEVLEIQGEKAAILGPIIGRYEEKFLDQAIDRTYKIEHAEGRLPEMPAVLEDHGGEQIRVKYIGPLATIQERLYKTTGVMHTISSIVPIADLQMSQAPIIDKFDFDEMAEVIAETHNLPQRAIRGDKDVAKIRQTRAEAQQQAQQVEVAERAAKAVPGLSKKEEAGSVMDEMRQGK